MYKQDMSSLLNQEQQLYQAICFSAEIQNPNKIKTRQLQEGGVLLHLLVQLVKKYKITCHKGNLLEVSYINFRIYYLIIFSIGNNSNSLSDYG
jgi:hypothetical protein